MRHCERYHRLAYLLADNRDRWTSLQLGCDCPKVILHGLHCLGAGGFLLDPAEG